MRFTLLCSLLCVACAPRATRPIRALSPEALRQVTPAARFATGAPTTNELRSQVEGALSPSTAALLRYEPALEHVARAIGETYADTGQPPARTLLWWLHWRAGVGGRPAGYWVVAGDGGGRGTALDRQLATWATRLNQQVNEPRAWAVVRFDTSTGDEAQALVLADDAVELDVPRVVHAGAPLEVKGRLRVPAQKLLLSLEDDARTVRQVEVPLDAEGRFQLTVSAPAKAGRRFLELVRLPPSPVGAQTWLRPVTLVPLLVDVTEPASAEPEVVTPRPNPADVKSWGAFVRAAWDAKRQQLALPPLVASPQLDGLAVNYAQRTAADPNAPPDVNLVGHVNALGVVSREVFAHTSEAEFLDELVWLEWSRPSYRASLLSPTSPVHGVGFELRPDGNFVFAEVIAQPVGVLDLAVELPKLEARFTELRSAAKKPALLKDAKLDAGLLAAVNKACESGQPLAKDDLVAALKAAQLNGPSAWVAGMSSRVLPEDLAGFAGDLPSNDATHFALAACQLRAGEKRGQELLVLFVLDAKLPAGKGK